MGQGTAEAAGLPVVANLRGVERDAAGFPPVGRVASKGLEAAGLAEMSGQDVLAVILRDGAQRLLTQAIEAEVAAYIEEHAACLDDRGHRLVVRNGRKDERRIQTGIGSVTVRQPRVHDRRIVRRQRVGFQVGGASECDGERRERKVVDHAWPR